MRKTRIPAQEQYQLIMQCRQSGLSDHQWCLEHDMSIPGDSEPPFRRHSTAVPF